MTGDMADADLYIDQIDSERYFAGNECRKCGVQSCRELVEKLKSRGHLPSVPQLQVPRPVTAGLLELNDPRPGDPILVTGNSEFTQQVLLAVLATTTSPFFVLFSDTRGDTLDMAMILESFTPERVRRSIEKERLKERAGGSCLVLPGLASKISGEIESQCGWPVGVGPVCAAELPIYFNERWRPA
ncbi:MAG TPA: hypothetical protein VM425_08120 [Myxococcota bacterium]|nr:hypothetical protein [Myxococcota bacterium]